MNDDDDRILESVRWQSPELLQGSSETLASNVHAFAMCILKALTGELPWGGVTSAVMCVLVDLGRLPNQPECMSDKQWELVQAMRMKDPMQWLEIAHVGLMLHGIAIQEQNQQTES